MTKRTTIRAYKKLRGPILRKVFYTTATEEQFEKAMKEIMERNAVMFSRLAK